MSTTQDLRADAAFIRELRDRLTGIAVECGVDQGDADRLEQIATKLEAVADIMFTPSLQLEGQVEEVLAASAKMWVKTGAEARAVLAALWLLSRRVKGAGNKSALGAGFAGFGAALGAAMVSGGKKGSD